MVKVIGKDDKHVHKVTCENCASVLEYTKKELLTYKHTDYGGGVDIIDYIDCPECGVKVEC